MPARRLVLVLVLVLTCAPACRAPRDDARADDRATPAAAPRAGAPTATTAADAGSAARPTPPVPTAAAVADLAWRWRTFRDAASEERALRTIWFVPDPAAVVRRGQTTALVRADSAGAVRWSATLATDGADGVALTTVGPLIVAAVFATSATGCAAVGIDAETGAIRWRTALTGIGSPGHSAYDNRVQLAVVDGKVAFYGRESLGSYVELIDPATGRSVAGARADATLVALPWPADRAPPRRYEPAAVRELAEAGDAVVRFSAGDKAHLERRAGGRRLWRVELPGNYGIGDAALAVDADTVYAVTYNRIATGAMLHAFARDDGKPRYEVPLEGIGPIGHSKYSNTLNLELADGRLTVIGDESGGRYLELRDAKTGAPIASLVFEL